MRNVPRTADEERSEKYLTPGESCTVKYTHVVQVSPVMNTKYYCVCMCVRARVCACFHLHRLVHRLLNRDRRRLGHHGGRAVALSAAAVGLVGRLSRRLVIPVGPSGVKPRNKQQKYRTRKFPKKQQLSCRYTKRVLRYDAWVRTPHPASPKLQPHVPACGCWYSPYGKNRTRASQTSHPATSFHLG